MFDIYLGVQIASLQKTHKETHHFFAGVFIFIRNNCIITSINCQG